MAVIEFSSSEAAPTELLYIMLYPLEPELRHNVSVLDNLGRLVDSTSDDDAALSVSRKDLRTALAMRSVAEVNSDMRERRSRAVIAGGLLLALYVMNRFALKPSMKRAIFSARAWAQTAEGFNDGSRRFATSPSEIRECWVEFSPVAHFWAALQMNRAYPYVMDGQELTKESLPAFLSVAATIYDFATRPFEPPPIKKGKGKPLVEPRSAWAPPRDTLRAKFNATLPPEVLLRRLKSYKAPKTKY